MGFHAGLGAVNGGLLGVDIFFVLSGFLVTSLLLAEHARTGTIKLIKFWGRRARRLLPALLVLLVGIGAYARWVGGGVPPTQLRGDALFTLIYAANWHFIASGQNYFVRFGALSPLLHTWSLAVEEQFYLVWPLIALVVLRRFGRRGRRLGGGRPRRGVRRRVRRAVPRRRLNRSSLLRDRYPGAIDHGRGRARGRRPPDQTG